MMIQHHAVVDNIKVISLGGKNSQLASIYVSNVTQHPHPEDIPTLMWWRGLRGHVNPRAMLMVAYATGRASHARQVKGDDPVEKGHLGPPGLGLGVGVTTPHHKNNLFQNLTISLRMRNKH